MENNLSFSKREDIVIKGILITFIYLIVISLKLGLKNLDLNEKTHLKINFIRKNNEKGIIENLSSRKYALTSMLVLFKNEEIRL